MPWKSICTLPDFLLFAYFSHLFQMNLIPISKETTEKQSNWHLFILKSFLRLWDSDELQWTISTINSTTNREPTILDLLSHCYSTKIITRTPHFIKWSHQHSEWWCCDGLGLLYCFRTWMTYCNWWHHACKKHEGSGVS